jgi:Gas vesicle synthesis protein GvpL/GvpF
MVLNGVYLVENEHRDEFLSLVNALQEKHEADGLELEATGPWPAYNFVPSQAGAAA